MFMFKSKSSIFLFFGLFVTVVTVFAQEQRPYRLDDNYGSEGISDVSFSPDGQVLVFVRARPRNTLPAKLQKPFERPREDIWLQDSSGQPARKITDGEKDLSKWWDPKWSPDGQKLAFLSSRNGNITIWVWEHSNNRVRQVSAQGVISRESTRFENFQWVDNERIVFLTPTNSDVVPLEDQQSLQNQASKAWEKAQRGEMTASAINSNEFNYPAYSIFLLNAVTGKGKRITTTVFRNHFYPDYWTSPDRRFIALVSPVSTMYNLESSIRMGFPHNVEIRTIEGELVKLDHPLPENIHTQTIKWSPDGRELSFFANGSGPINPILLYGVSAAEVMPDEEKKASLENPAKLYRVNIEKKTIEQIGTGEIDLGPLGSPDFMWTASGELIFNAPKRRYGQTAGHPPGRGAQWGVSTSNARAVSLQPPNEWLVLDRNGNTRPLSKNLPKIEGRLWSINGGAELLTISDGEVIGINPTSGEVRNLTAKFDPKVGNFLRTDTSHFDRQGLMAPNEFPPVISKLVLTKRGPLTVDSNYVLDLNSGETTLLKRPEAGGSILTFNQDSGSAAFLLNNANGLYLWRGNLTGKIDQLLKTNIYLRDIETAETRIFEYRSLNGEILKGLMALPPGYTQGRKYPVYVDVYPYTMVEGSISTVGRAFPTGNTNLVTTAGYVHLEPSEPITLPGMSGQRITDLGGEEGQSCVTVANGVIPAVEKLVEMGIADPERVFIRGISWGGWMVQCMVTQTTRFRAAVAIASGATDPRTTHWWGGTTYRYSDNPSRWVGTTYLYRHLVPAETPWWRDGDRIKRNNPLTYADHVKTPLLLIHGDEDGISIDTSEDFFNALVSMRKPARFVRYWGEDHGFASPLNIRDSWIQIFAWFDQWGDITRDEKGNLIFDGDRVKGRNGAPPLKPEDYAKFNLFQPSPVRNNTDSNGH